MIVALNTGGGYRVNKKSIFFLFHTVGRVFPAYASQELSLAFVSDYEIKKLNAAYRRKNKPTDVLSFAERDVRQGLGDRTYLGEIVIAYPYARRQAVRYHRTLNQEISLLLVHGFLHLIGYDHLNKKDEQQMMGLERTILSKFYKRSINHGNH